MRIGEVAEHAGVNIETLRYYERRGLVKMPGRRPSGYRDYVPDTVRIVRFIKRAQKLGFNLEEIEDLLSLRERGNRLEMKSLAQAKVKDIEGKIAHLEAIKQALVPLIAACQCASGHLACPIIEALDDGADEPEAAR